MKSLVPLKPSLHWGVGWGPGQLGLILDMEVGGPVYGGGGGVGAS